MIAGRTGGTGEGGHIVTNGDDAITAPGRRRSPASHVAILEATRQILDEVGYFRLTVEGVAARAGVGKTTVYRWWPSKSALVLEAVTARRPTPPAPTGDLRTDLGAAMHATLDFLSSDLTPTVLALAAELMHGAGDPEDATDLFQVDHDAVGVLLDEHRARGALPADVDIRLLQDVYTGTLLYRVLTGRPIDDIVERLLDLLVGAAEPGTGSPTADRHAGPTPL